MKIGSQYCPPCVQMDICRARNPCATETCPYYLQIPIPLTKKGGAHTEFSFPLNLLKGAIILQHGDVPDRILEQRRPHSSIT